MGQACNNLTTCMGLFHFLFGVSPTHLKAPELRARRHSSKSNPDSPDGPTPDHFEVPSHRGERTQCSGCSLQGADMLE